MADEKVMEWIQRELDGDLSLDEQKRLEAVLAGSPEDARLRDEMRRLSERLAGLPRVEPPVSVAERVIGRIEARQKLEDEGNQAGRAGIWRMRYAAAAVVLMLGLGGWLFIRQENGAVHQAFDPVGPAGQPSVKDRRTEMLPSASTADSTAPKILSAPEAGVLSPDGRFAASWKNGVLVIRDRSGRETYRSRPFPDKAAPEILWQSSRVLRLSWPASGKAVMVDVEAARKKQ